MIRVVTANGEEIQDAPTVNADAIAHLERLLDRARAGQLTTLAFVASGPHHTDRGFCGIEEVGEAVYLLGLLRRLDRIIQERADFLSEPIAEFIAP